MELLLKRTHCLDTSTIGELYIDGTLKYYTMEDKDRLVETLGCAAKIAKETCIPRGKYQVIIDYSNRFKRDMPHVRDVPCFDGIRIHVGNYIGDTEGCILVGTQHQVKPVPMVMNSRVAFNEFFPLLQEALKEGKVWITIQ